LENIKGFGDVFMYDSDVFDYCRVFLYILILLRRVRMGRLLYTIVGGFMCVLVVSVGILGAEGGFLEGVSAEDLEVDTIVEPEVRDTNGISDWIEYYYGRTIGVNLSPDSSMAMWVEDASVDKKQERFLCIMDYRTKELKVLKRRPAMPRWSPDGKMIAFLERRPREGEFYNGYQLYGDCELWIYELATGKVWKVTSGINVRGYVWCSDSRHIVFDYGICDTVARRVIAGVGVVDVYTGEFTCIDSAVTLADFHYSVSPDGRMVAYTKPFKEERHPDIYVTDAELFIANIDGTGRNQLMETEGVEEFVKWLGDGRSLIVEYRDGRVKKVILRKKRK